MSIYELLTPIPKPWANINVNSINVDTDANINNVLTVNQLNVTGSANLASASARYNLAPQPPSRVGLLTGYLIFASDPNPSFIPFTTTTPQGLFDFINPSGNFSMIDPYTLQFDKAGFYSISFSFIVLSNSPSEIIFQLLSSKYPFTVGTVPPVITSFGLLMPQSLLLAPYSHVFTYNVSSNGSFDIGEQLKLAYLTSADSEISLTSNFSISKIG